MKFKDFIGKTISEVDESCVNVARFIFTDGTSIEVFAECGTSFTSIPYFDVMEIEHETL